jgi:hypothetical protein
MDNANHPAHIEFDDLQIRVISRDPWHTTPPSSLQRPLLGPFAHIAPFNLLEQYNRPPLKVLSLLARDWHGVRVVHLQVDVGLERLEWTDRIRGKARVV